MATLPTAIAGCTALALPALYVASLYTLVPTATQALPRSAPAHIWARLRATIAASALCGGLSLLALSALGGGGGAYAAYGLQPECHTLSGLFGPAACALLLLAGPLLQKALAWGRAPPSPPTHLGWPSLPTLRNLVFAPITEEWTFRACVLPLYLGAGFSGRSAVGATSVAFGAAHVHHYLEAVAQGRSPASAAAGVAAQAAYTTVYGAVAAWFLLTTHSLPGVVLQHAVCNAVGLPDADAWAAAGRPERTVVAGVTIAGLALFAARSGELLHALGPGCAV